MILLPEELKNNDKDINRVYYVLRRHMNDNKAEIDKIEAKLSEDGKYLVFKTDRFSTYALGYVDEEVKEEIKEELPPKTYDGFVSYMLIGMISFIMFIVLCRYIKNKKIYN